MFFYMPSLESMCRRCYNRNSPGWEYFKTLNWWGKTVNRQIKESRTLFAACGFTSWKFRQSRDAFRLLMVSMERRQFPSSTLSGDSMLGLFTLFKPLLLCFSSLQFCQDDPDHSFHLSSLHSQYSRTSQPHLWNITMGDLVCQHEFILFRWFNTAIALFILFKKGKYTAPLTSICYFAYNTLKSSWRWKLLFGKVQTPCSVTIDTLYLWCVKFP